MSSFFLKSPKDYIKSELDARKDLSAVSKMRPWVSVTSNLDPQFTLGTSTYFQLFGSKGLLNNGGDVRFVGNPIVEEFSVDFSERGTLRKATIKITCFTIEQFENMQKYFMEPGLSIFVQWGWNFTAESRKAISPLPIGVETQSKYYRNFKELEKIRDSNNGCYDNMLGIINRAQSEIVGNQFTITTKIVSLGELISGRPPSGVVTDRTALDPTQGDLVGTPTLISEEDLKKKQKSEKLHWYYFYNSLPEQFRSVSFSDLENIPKGINAGTDFLNYDDRLLENAKTETSTEGDKNKLWIVDKGFVPADETSPFKGKKYIKFSAFIILLNKINDILFNTEQETGDVQFSIDIGTFESPKTLCSSFKNIFSAGDAIFIPNQNSYNFLNQNPYYYNQNEFGTIHSFWNNSVVGYNNEIISFPFGTRRELPDGTSFEAFHSGWIGDVYLDHDIAMQALNNTSKPLKDTLDGVLKEMSRAVDGFWDFQIIDDPEKNSIRIVEINLRNSNKLNPLKLDFLGKESIFLESNFNFDIPKEISNMIVLTKTDKSAITQESKLNGLYSDSKDVVLSKLIKKKAENKAKTAPQPNLSLLDDKRLWKGITQDCRLLLQPYASRLHEEFPASQEEQKNIILIGCSNNKEAFNRIIKNAIAKNLTGYAPIHAIKASFTILGISGFKFGDVLDIRGIPKKYTNGTNGLFMITEVTHKLDNELWTTNVTLMFRPNFGR